MTLTRTEFRRKTSMSEPKPSKGPRMRKCAVQACRTLFAPRNMMHKACSPECAELVGIEASKKLARKAEKADRAETKAKLLEMEPAKYWRKKAKTAMHAYVRAIAEGQPCCSCDTILLKLGRVGGDYDAGHFRGVGRAKHLEFDPRNIWGQCKHCNDHLNGNYQEYERRLRIKKGDAFVDELLADNEDRHLKIHDYQAIEAEYKAKLRALTKGQQ